MASYQLSRKALADLDRLYETGILQFGLREADRYYDGLLERFQKIADAPLRYPSIDHIKQGYRRSVYRSHSIYYRVGENDVFIVRILGRQDLMQSLA